MLFHGTRVLPLAMAESAGSEPDPVGAVPRSDESAEGTELGKLDRGEKIKLLKVCLSVRNGGGACSEARAARGALNWTAWSFHPSKPCGCDVRAAV
jgi:hypothetical protein